jgi:hypothetical protein
MDKAEYDQLVEKAATEYSFFTLQHNKIKTVAEQQR